MLPAVFVQILIFLIDLLSFLLSLFLAFLIFPHGEILFEESKILFPYFSLLPLLFLSKGLYTRNYDFWHESRLILSSLGITFLLMFATAIVTPNLHSVHYFFLLFLFFLMIVILPTFKRMFKIAFYKRIGLRKPIKILNESEEIAKEIYENPYLGYRRCHENEIPHAVIVNSKHTNPETLQKKIEEEMQRHREILFIPYLNDYDLTHAQIYELTNARSNLILLQNRLLSRIRRWIKELIDLGIALILIPFLFPIMLLIAALIKYSEPGGRILFRQKRLGYRGKVFTCYKFRTMKEEGEEILEKYLRENPDEFKYYQQYHKYRYDPRVTKIGRFLRKSSLDELPQIFNVIKREMSFVGPRPYMLEEKEEVAEALETILKVRPGITGLWQVEGRNRLDFRQRIELELWYIRNWSLWLDFVILLKTIRSVLKKEGAI